MTLDEIKKENEMWQRNPKYMDATDFVTVIVPQLLDAIGDRCWYLSVKGKPQCRPEKWDGKSRAWIPCPYCRLQEKV